MEANDDLQVKLSFACGTFLLTVKAVAVLLAALLLCFVGFPTLLSQGYCFPAV